MSQKVNVICVTDVNRLRAALSMESTRQCALPDPCPLRTEAQPACGMLHFSYKSDDQSPQEERL